MTRKKTPQTWTGSSCRQFREGLGWSREQLASVVGKALSTVVAFERGERDEIDWEAELNHVRRAHEERSLIWSTPMPLEGYFGQAVEVRVRLEENGKRRIQIGRTRFPATDQALFVPFFDPGGFPAEVVGSPAQMRELLQGYRSVAQLHEETLEKENVSM